MTNWWDNGNEPEGSEGGEKNGVGSLGQGLRDGMGIGFVTMAEAGFFPAFTSSTFTSRNYGAGMDPTEIEIDLFWAFVLSVVVGAVIAYYLKSTITLVWAFVLGGMISLLYIIRGGLLQLPWNIPLLTPKASAT